MAIVVFPKEYILDSASDSDIGVDPKSIVQIIRKPLFDDATIIEYYKAEDKPAMLKLDLNISEVCILIADALKK